MKHVSLRRRACAGCGKIAPLTFTAHTLIGSGHGWRVVRSSAGTAEWRCPECWRAFKEKRGQEEP